MLREITEALSDYQKDWSGFESEHDLGNIVGRPTAVGWKVADIAAFNLSLAELLGEGGDQVHIGRVNDRLIASVVLPESLVWGIRIVKLMQRRPGSEDPVGLDHVDFLVAGDWEDTVAKVEKIPGFEIESNDAHKWISLRFGDREAKLVDHTVLEVCITELKDASKSILSDS